MSARRRGTQPLAVRRPYVPEGARGLSGGPGGNRTRVRTASALLHTAIAVRPGRDMLPPSVTRTNTTRGAVFDRWQSPDPVLTYYPPRRAAPLWLPRLPARRPVDDNHALALLFFVAERPDGTCTRADLRSLSLPSLGLYCSELQAAPPRTSSLRGVTPDYPAGPSAPGRSARISAAAVRTLAESFRQTTRAGKRTCRG